MRVGPVHIAVALGCAILLQTGCGSSVYEEKFQASLDELKNEAPFRHLYDVATPIPDTPLSVRLPKLFDGRASALDAKTPDPKINTRPLNPDRLQPNFIKLPGYVRTYERFMPTIQTHDTSACYCYIAVTDIDTGSQENLEADLRNKLLETFDESRTEDAKRRGGPPVEKGVTEWKEIEVPTPAGGDNKLKLKKIVANGNQTFRYYDPQGDGLNKLRHGKYILYFYSNEHDRSDGQPIQFVLIGWRAEEIVANHEEIELEKLGDAVAGTIALDYSKLKKKTGD